MFHHFRGDGFWKVTCLFIGCLLRCVICPVFGFLNLFTSVTEGFANALIGDFEQFARMQEQSDFLAKAQRRSSGFAAGNNSGAFNRTARSSAEATVAALTNFGLTHGGSSSLSRGRLTSKRSKGNQ